MSSEIIIILYVAILGLLGSVFLLDFYWSRKSEQITRGVRRASNPHKLS